MGRLIASDLCNAAEFSRDRANLDLHPAVDHAVLLAAIERRAGQTFRDIFDPPEEGPYLVDRVGDDEALPELDLRLPIGLDARGRARRSHSWGGASAGGGNRCGGGRAHFAGAPRSGWPQSLAAASWDGRDAACTTVGKHGLDRAHDADITCASAEIAAHRDADVVLARRFHAQHNVARRNNHAGSAIAALQSMMSRESRPQLARNLVLVEAFDGGDFGVFASDREGDARAYRHVVDEEGAGAADAVFAADMRAGPVVRLA